MGRTHPPSGIDAMENLMSRSYSTRYLGNTNTKEVHDLHRETEQCQIDSIIEACHDKGFAALADAAAEGYDNCGHCLGGSTR